VGAALSAAFLAARRLPAPARARLALLVASSGVSLFCLEGVSAYLERPEDAIHARAEACRATGKEYDSRPLWEVVQALRGQGKNAVPSIHPSDFYEEHSELCLGNAGLIPLGGVANRTTVVDNETGDYLIYDSDEHGFHNPTGLYVPGQVEIALVGDSFAQGCCVPSDRNFAALIRDRHPRTLNVGMYGNGPLCELATLTEYAKPLRAKTVLWCFFEGNDLSDLAEEEQSPLIRYLEDSTYSAGLLALQPQIDVALERIIDEQLVLMQSEPLLLRAGRTAGEFLTLHNLRARLARVFRPHSPGTARPKDLELFERVLRCAKGRAEEFGARLVFVYLPEYDRYARSSRPYSDQVYARVKQIVRELGVAFVDVRRAFDRHPDPLALFPFRLPGHYSEEGNREAADTVLEKLR
jgi:hypothetical protein